MIKLKADSIAIRDESDGSYKKFTAIKGDGVPLGGTESQVLIKKSDTDLDTEWEDCGQLVEIVQIKSRIKTIEDDYLKSSDKTELQENIDKKVDLVDGSSLVPDSKVTSYDEHIANEDIHVTSDEKKTWNAKANANDVYTKEETDEKITNLGLSVVDGKLCMTYEEE